MDKVTYVGNADVNAIDDLYSRYRKDPNSVDEGWKKFFEGFEFAQTNYEDGGEVPENYQKEFKVVNLIEGYRNRGHYFTKTNPVRARREYQPTLDIENFGLSSEDLNTVFQAGDRIGIGPATLKEIIDHLEQAYCESIGIEYSYIRNPERKEWLMNKLEVKNRPQFSADDKKQIFKKLSEANLFEQFLQKKYVGQKRFSVEGSEAMISGLDEMIRSSGDLGVKEFVFGMAHRGRLNVLVNILNKPLIDLFNEFEGKEFDDIESFDGDVKYHLGLSSTVESKGKEIGLTLSPNPSHLEAVSSVVQGIARAKSDNYFESRKEVVPVLIHGDAALSAQGIVYEVVQMAELKGFSTGGTIHVVANNQVGFTTNYTDGRSSTYCTDIAKIINAPVFHINGDDPEAVSQAFLIALEYRQMFNKDIFIDILSYRKYGHNEGDEPKFTQPNLYKAIAKHPNPREIYKKQLISEGVIDEAYDKKVQDEVYERLDVAYEAAKKIDKALVRNFMYNLWKDVQPCKSEKEIFEVTNTKVDKKDLLQLAKNVASLPQDKNIFRKIVKLFKDREQMIEDDIYDWGMGEMLAYASLLAEGHNVRFTGQDVERGTFSHRHAVVTTEDTEERVIPLNSVAKQQGEYRIYNSLLSEFAVLGYEYGYSITTPNDLTIWEAQFGDFYNGAQIMVDQFITAGEDKWNVQSGLVVLLPHGYEGQGSEHSSGRMERFLQNCAGLNIQVINASTPANQYHALRRQLKRSFRKPLFSFSPKMLLRHPRAISKLDDFANGQFQEVIDDPRNLQQKATAVVLCNGKAYYDFLEAAEERGINEDIAFVRVEQLYPLPKKQIDEVLAKYKKAEHIIWGQEEPENMGAWTFMAMNLRHIDLKCVARPASASPATGSKVIHLRRLKDLHEKLFNYVKVAVK